MMPALIAIVALSIGPADTWTPPAEWLDRTMRLESSGNRWAVGDGGRSRGPYQIQRRPWEAFGGKRPWSNWAHDPAESRRVANRILSACSRACRRVGKPVTFDNCRWFYRHGGF